MVEKDYYNSINKYYTANATNSIAWEAKITKSNTMNFSCLAPHQEESLLVAERSFGYKIPDSGISKKGFDGFVLYRATALFIAIYYIPHKTEIYEIPIRAFLKEKYESGKKSLSKERAREIGKVLSLQK
jgi:hypothetical protein